MYVYITSLEAFHIVIYIIYAGLTKGATYTQVSGTTCRDMQNETLEDATRESMHVACTQLLFLWPTL